MIERLSPADAGFDKFLMPSSPSPYGLGFMLPPSKDGFMHKLS